MVKIRLTRALPIALSTAALIVSAWATPANAAGSQGTFSWRSGYNGRCVDADSNANGFNGTRIQLWDCKGNTWQGWVKYSDGTIRPSRNTKKCLDADLNTINNNGTRLQLWDCNKSLQQRWNIMQQSSSGIHRILSQYNGKCIDADLNTIGRNGTKMQLWDCNSKPQQGWRTLYL